jgi:hypothetical protein
LAAGLVGRTLSDVQGDNGLILTFGDRHVIITSADPYQPLEVEVRSSKAAEMSHVRDGRDCDTEGRAADLREDDAPS